MSTDMIREGFFEVKQVEALVNIILEESLTPGRCDDMDRIETMWRIKHGKRNRRCKDARAYPCIRWPGFTREEVKFLSEAAFSGYPLGTT